MVRKHHRQRETPSGKLAALLNESETSSSDDDDSANLPSQNTNRNKSKAQQQQKQKSASTSKAGETSKQNQPSTSKANQEKEKPKGAAKRKPKTTNKNMNALFQIFKLQNTTENLIPKSPFCRCVKEVLHSHGEYRMTKDSLDALQEAAEAFMIGVFNDGYRLTLHRSRVTIMPSDIQLLMYLRGGTNPGVP